MHHIMGRTVVESACLSNNTVSHLRFLFFSTYTFTPVCFMFMDIDKYNYGMFRNE